MQSTIKKAQYLKLAFSLFALFTLLFSPLTSSVSEASVSVVGGLSREMTVQIGQTYQGIIFLKNHGEKSQEVKLYQTDYLFFSDGTNIYGEPGELERSNANWLSLSPTRVEVPPGGTVSISYILEVPDNDSLVGTYWSMLMVEPLVEMKELPENDQTRLGIRQVVRYGMQFVTHIGDTGRCELKFPTHPKLLVKKKEGRKVFQLDLENTGQHSLRPEVWVELYNEEGLLIGRFESGRKRIYPGTSVRHSIDLSDVPKGKYDVLVVADNGDDYFPVGAQYTLDF